MKKKTVSIVILALLLICMSTWEFNIQPINADRKTITNNNKIGNGERVRIVEHEISTSELKELKRKFGVWEKGIDYNRIIDGHGTGLHPPKEEEWAEIADQAHVVERILLEDTTELPSNVDHTTKPSFPPIGNQDGEGSCTTWAVGYYTKTFQEAAEHGWDLSGAEWVGGYYGYPTPAYQDRIFSPDFIYHLINGGVDYGSSFYDAINLVCSIGASSWKEMPYDPGDSTSWPSEDAWREAPLYRGNSSGFEYLELSTDDDLMSLKNWIASDHLAVIAVDANQYSGLTSKDIWTLDNYVNPSINHANTIVGYDDTLTYVEKGLTRQGAFKIANSWGEGGWENIQDGCYWISYEAMKQHVGSCMFYRDRIGYDPKLVASFKIDHSKRRECNILIGMGNYSDALATKSFSDLIDGGNYPFCSNNIVLDVTEFEDAVPGVINQSFFMRARAGVPAAHSGTYEWYSDGASYSWFRLNQTFDIPETGATLKFWSYFEIEEDWDYGYVEVHDLNTDEWFTLPGHITVSTLPERQDNPNCPQEFEPTAYYDAGRWNAFTGFSGDLYEEEMDLTPFANHTIELYFTYWTDPYALERGWYIDDIEIPEIGFFDDVESGPNDWTYNGWYITTPPTSTTGTLLSFSIEYYQNYSTRSLNARSTSYDVPLNVTNQNVFAELILKNIWTVDDDGPADFHAIQEAINAAIDGNTIFVYNGTYYENAVLNKTVSLIGENKSITIVDGSYVRNVMNITANNVNITGFTMKNTGPSPNCGIYISSSGNNISYNVITNNHHGIGLSNSSNNIIYGNSITDNYCGVYLDGSSDNTFHHNKFIDNTQQVYVEMSGSANLWNYSYPLGGNYWSDYTGEDNYLGSNQDQEGSDGIGDTPYVIDANNTDNYPLMKPYGGPYDIGIANITTSKTVVSQGYSLDITIKIINYGINTETFNLTTYANTTIIQAITNVVLASRNSTTITFTWDTTDFFKGGYTISSYATPVPSEMDTEDNSYTGDTVIVTIVGDINGDSIVDVWDITMVAMSYGYFKGEPNYNPVADINEDGIIDMLDLSLVAIHLGETDP